MNRFQSGPRALCAAAGVAATMLLATTTLVRASDEVIFWNNVLLSEFRTDFSTGCPCPLARSGAMTQIAVYEAVNSIERSHHPYYQFLPASPTASKEAAVATAAHDVMAALFTNSAASLDSTLAARLALIPAGPDKDDGIAIGHAAAQMILTLRAGDGSQTKIPYTFGTNPGDYRPTSASDFVCSNEWPLVTPFCMNHGTDFRKPSGPGGHTVMSELLASPEYAADLNEVKELGALNSPSRTAEQTQIAFFWANDLNGTYKPPGHLFSITRIVSEDHALSLEQNARLFALVGMAMGDAGIVGWDMKYATDIDLWRPVTAIQLADTDGNPATTADPAWQPLNPFTPPFPSWVSGHATFAAAQAGVMAEFFGTDDVTFTVTSEDPLYHQLPQHPPRTFHSFSQAAWENALSRVYLGVHFRMDAVDGNAAGLALGHSVAQSFLLPLCSSDFDGNSWVNGADFDQFIAAFEAGDPAADVDGNTFVNADDFDLFVVRFENGC